MRDETETEGISLEAMNLFTPLVDRDKLHDVSIKIIDRAVHERYPNKKAKWHGPWWYVTLPHPGYDAKDVPQIEFEVSIHLVASIKVETDWNVHPLTLVGTLGKPERLGT